MARPSKRQTRALRRTQEKALQLMLLGAGLAMAPLLLRGSPLGKALGGMVPVGLVLLAIGGALLWWHRRQPLEGTAMPEPRMHRGARPPAQPAPRETTSPPARPTAWSKAVFHVIEWRRFEAVVEALFQQAGFVTQAQSHGADGGVDIWLYSRHQPGRPASLVQCKHWQGRQVGVDKIRELRGVMAAHNVKRGQFATTSTFSDDAQAFARDNGVHLLDVRRLLELIDTRTPEQQQALLQVALEGEYWRPTCVSCGVKMVERTAGKDGTAFWGCVNFPRCRKKLFKKLAGAVQAPP